MAEFSICDGVGIYERIPRKERIVTRFIAALSKSL